MRISDWSSDVCSSDLQDAVTAFAAKHFLPAIGDDIELVPRHVHREPGRCRVGEYQALAIVADPLAIGNAHARGGAVPGDADVLFLIDAGQVGQLAIRRCSDIASASGSTSGRERVGQYV